MAPITRIKVKRTALIRTLEGKRNELTKTLKANLAKWDAYTEKYAAWLGEAVVETVAAADADRLVESAMIYDGWLRLDASISKTLMRRKPKRPGIKVTDTYGRVYEAESRHHIAHAEREVEELDKLIRALKLGAEDTISVALNDTDVYGRWL